jgi:hypothetical protein
LAINSPADALSKRDRTFLFIVRPEQYKRQEALAYELHTAVTVVDWREEFLSEAQPGQNYLNLSVGGELDRLKKLSRLHRDKILCVINTEYPLTRFNRHDRQTFWRGLWTDFPYSDAVIIYVSLDVEEVLPSPVELERWEASGRVLRPRR